MTTNNILVQSPSCILIWNSGVLLKYRHVNYVSNKQFPHAVKGLESYAMKWETTKIYSQRPIWPRVNFCGSFWKQPTVKLISH